MPSLGVTTIEFGVVPSWREILVGVVGDSGVEAGIDDIGRGDDEQRIAVGLRMRCISDPDIAAGAGLVLDDDVAGKGGAEILRENARHDVGGAGSRERHDHLDRPLGIAGRLRRGDPEV
jgi:hypothetical protein